MRWILIAGVVSLTACATPQEIVMRDPVTQKTSVCRDVNVDAALKHHSAKCAAALEAAGWNRVAQFDN